MMIMKRHFLFSVTFIFPGFTLCYVASFLARDTKIFLED